MTIHVAAGWSSGPCVAKRFHPALGGLQANGNRGAVLRHNLRTVNIINDVLCLDILPNTLEVLAELLTEFWFGVKVGGISSTQSVAWQ